MTTKMRDSNGGGGGGGGDRREDLSEIKCEKAMKCRISAKYYQINY